MRRRKLQSMPSNVVSIADHAMEQEHSDEEGLQGRSLFLFGPTNRFRKMLAAIIWHPRFEQVVIALICLSSITLALDSPRLHPNGKFKQVLVRQAIDAVFLYHPTSCGPSLILRLHRRSIHLVVATTSFITICCCRLSSISVLLSSLRWKRQ